LSLSALASQWAILIDASYPYDILGQCDILDRCGIPVRYGHSGSPRHCAISTFRDNNSRPKLQYSRQDSRQAWQPSSLARPYGNRGRFFWAGGE
jgi:hypothetical protein